jgi:Flp pilus assembly protein TadD
MLPPTLMLTIKNRPFDNPVKSQELPDNYSSFASRCIITLVLLIAGCTPPGPRALLDGQKLLERGKYSQAVEKLQTATTLLATNAHAWNYLGLACQHAGQPVEAEKAYQRALILDHDLSEAHYNLGCLLLDQGKLEGAKSELTAYTLRRANAAQGFLKLAAAQLRSAELERVATSRARELNAAEKSYKDALRLSPQNPEAHNGLGLVALHHGRAGDAAQHFSAALKQQPNYAPALLNLAIVSQQYLKDRPFALQKYREYAALKPAPDNVEAVQATARQLELEINALAHPAVTNQARTINTNIGSAPKPAATNAAEPRGAIPTKIAPSNTPPKAVTATPTNAAKPTPALGASKPTAIVTSSKPAPVITPLPTSSVPTNIEHVKLVTEPAFKLADDLPSTSSPPQASTAVPPSTTPTSSPPARFADAKAAQHGLLQRLNPANLFHGEEKSRIQTTPLPPYTAALDAQATNQSGDAEELTDAAQSTSTSTDRYAYRHPAKPNPGNRAEAERSFSQGVQFQKSHQVADAVSAYRKAGRLDPSYFEAHYNLGLALSEAGNLQSALRAYEMALAVRSDSLDARLNFALILKQTNYPIDAANELEKILETSPNETRAHLTLANLYAQQLHQPAKARAHYLKVLAADPRHPQAGTIRYWLAANPL